MNRKPSLFSRLMTGLIFLFLYAPIFVLIIFSFNNSKSRSVWAGFTLDWYDKLFHDQMILDALYTTLAVSVLAAVIATVAGTFAVFCLSRLGTTAVFLSAGSCCLGFALPGTYGLTAASELPRPVLFSDFGTKVFTVSGSRGSSTFLISSFAKADFLSMLLSTASASFNISSIERSLFSLI